MFLTQKKAQFLNALRGGLMILVMFFSSQMVYSQVTIGSGESPHRDALLDLKQGGDTKGGLLLPRVALQYTTSFAPMTAHTQGMTVYNTATAGDVTPGFYYNNGTKWMKLFSAEDSFFYMPSTVLPIDENDPSFGGGLFTVNLYDAYREQFGLSATNIVVSDNSAKLPIYGSNELYYFITYYDDEVFDNVAISSAGVLTYKIKSGFQFSEKTYMNIIFKVK